MASPVGCPVHVILDQLAFLKRQWPTAWSQGRPHRDLPLFPAFSGKACGKPAMTGTIVEAACRLGVPLADSDGTTRVSGHSLRVSGAQGLSRAGFPLWSIQLLGRWGSETVKQYVGATALDVFVEPTAAAPGGEQMDVHDLVASLGRMAGQSRRERGGDRLTDRRPDRSAPARAAPDADVIRVVTEQIDPLRHDLFDALAHQVTQEVAAQLADRADRPDTTDRGTTPDPVRVQNSRTKAWHRSVVGPWTGQPSRWWGALCGWAFGRSPDGFAVGVPPQLHESCERCDKFARQRGLLDACPVAAPA